MASRMEKYHSDNTKNAYKRSEKNEKLYKQLYTNKIVTEFTNIDGVNVVDLSSIPTDVNFSRRENYQKNKLFNSDETVLKTDDDNDLINNHKKELESEEKIYNINDILANAKKNRVIDDATEKRRHLKSVEYNILSDLSQEKVKNYHEQKKKLSKEEEENLEELIHTITSNSLRKKLDDELLGDLLPEEENETIVSASLATQLNDEIEKIAEDEETNQTIDNSFYTKSMELSRDDFELDEDDNSFLDDKRMSLPIKFLIVVFILVVIAVIGYVIYKFI